MVTLRSTPPAVSATARTYWSSRFQVSSADHSMCRLWTVCHEPIHIRAARCAALGRPHIALSSVCYQSLVVVVVVVAIAATAVVVVVVVIAVTATAVVVVVVVIAVTATAVVVVVVVIAVTATA
ncbi:hypothetical protein ACIF80_14890, partial [Streptomyces sp. NPDC085927]|uniref:hypothetical protein n=1 Tax=Streptomyces sp. NPDC085927 TaxID=3365738 RepID=UPI0037D42589